MQTTKNNGTNKKEPIPTKMPIIKLCVLKRLHKEIVL